MFDPVDVTIGSLYHSYMSGTSIGYYPGGFGRSEWAGCKTGIFFTYYETRSSYPSNAKYGSLQSVSLES